MRHPTKADEGQRQNAIRHNAVILVFLCEIATQRGIGRGAASLGAGRVPRGSRGAGTSEYLCRMERPGERLRE